MAPGIDCALRFFAGGPFVSSPQEVFVNLAAVLVTGLFAGGVSAPPCRAAC
jgi:hypothetical protein